MTKEKLLFTGASGFLGFNIRPILEKTYDIHTLGLADEDDFKCDLAVEEPPLHTHYDVVLHAAGRAHISPNTEAERQAFYDVNYQGTVHLCKALEKAGIPKSLVFISSVAVYGCEIGELIDESHPLNGSISYAKSKIMAEQYLTEWCAKHGVVLGILRPSLIAGRKAPGNLGAMVHGIQKGWYMNVAGGKAKKSVLMAEDIANLLPLLAEKGGVYNVCDSYQPTMGELSISLAKQLGKHKPISLPYWMAWCAAMLGDIVGVKFPFNSNKLVRMTKTLTFSNKKACAELGWKPLDVLKNFSI